MATENAVMAAAVAEGRTRIANAASEPHVQGLCRLLNAMGARIRGVGTNVLDVEGVAELRPAAHRIGPDHIEIGSFVAIAAMTGGELRIAEVEPDDLRMIRMVFARLGVRIEIEGRTLTVPGKQELVVQDDLDGAIPKVDDAPWPGLPERSHADRARARHAGARHRADPREDVREPAVLRGPPDLDGRARRALRSRTAPS